MFLDSLRSECGSDLSAAQLAALEAHYALLCRWNETLNLTRITDLTESVRLHYCESIFLARALPGGPLKVADIGSGAGFPGIPLAIARPEVSVDLVESHKRKAVFLRETTRSLRNVRVLAERAEDVPLAYDWVVSRAVDPSRVLRLRQARDFALLMSTPDIPALPEPSSIQKIPWGRDRVLVKFHVER